MKVQSIYNSEILKKGLEFAANNGALFTATASLALSTVARPAVILFTPNTDEKNKQYACSKSIASSAIGYLLMLLVSSPVAKAIKKIDQKPSQYLKNETIEALKNSGNTLSKSSRYKFATQLFKLGIGFLIAVPKSLVTCALIPPIMSKIFPDKHKSQNNITFTGNLSQGIGKIIDKKWVQKLAEKFHNTKFEQNIIYLTDMLATGAFIEQTRKSKKIDQNRKKALIYNAAISTGLCIAGTSIIDKISDKSTKKFIEKFKAANKNSPKLDKYLEGIKIAKPVLIMGGIYYIAIPLISTFLADKFDKTSKNLQK